MKKVALLLGASGSVGSELLKALLESPAYGTVVIFVRKPLDANALPSGGKLMQKSVSAMTPASLSAAVEETVREFAAKDPTAELAGFSALGVGAKTADLTIDEHRAVDVELNRAFAQALRSSGHVPSLSFLSAMGANPKAKITGSGAAGMPRYARVKGEAEEAVKLHGPKAVHIFHPAIIRGSQHTPKAIEFVALVFDFLLPKRMHSVTTRELGQAMLAASLAPGLPSGTFNYTQMRKLISQTEAAKPRG